MNKKRYIRAVILVFAAAIIIAGHGCTWNIKATNGGLTLCVTWVHQSDTGSRPTDTEGTDDEKRTVGEDVLTETIEKLDLEKLDAF